MVTVPTARMRLQAGRKLVNTWLAEDLRFGRAVPSRLSAAMRYAVIGRGKRLRAVLTLESYRAAGGRRLSEVRGFCSGIEMIQAFSLVHDDLPCMDNDDFRRGKPSLHRRFDEATAVLAGDALLAQAFLLFSTGPCNLQRRMEAVRLLARAVGPAGMAGGQMLDLRALDPRRTAMMVVNRRKTAEFIAASLECGAVVAGASRSVCRQLHEAGILVGTLFQATDDVLDSRDGRDDGKPMALDAEGVECALRRAGREAETAERLLHRLGPDYHFLAALPQLILYRGR